MIITKKAIPRRAVLRGLGATVALPVLDSMVPALSALEKTGAAPVRRLGFTYVPNGVNGASWTPVGKGSGFSLSATLAPLEPFRRHMVVLSELSSLSADGNHPTAGAAWLTGNRAKRTEGSDVYLGKSLDQFAADELGKETQLRSLQLAADDTVNVCDGYACSYQNTLCWRTPTLPLPMQNNPRVVFERLFGDGSSDETRRARRRAQDSILDAIAQEAVRLMQRVGVADRARLNDYLDGIRELERRIQKMEQRQAIEFSVEMPTGMPDLFDERIRLMFDLQVAAYQADLTRVITFMVSRETSQQTFVHIGVPEAHHGLSHHGDSPEMLEKLAKIDKYHVELLAYFLEKLASTPDGDGSLLDHSLLMYGSGMGNGNTHSSRNLPTLVLGGGVGRMKGDRHVLCATDTPLTNLQLTLLDKAGIHLESFGDSTGRVSDL